MEDYIAKKMLTLQNGLVDSATGSMNDIEQYEKIEQIELHENQKQAILAGANEPIAIITGGPGTGKTTIIKAILRLSCLLDNDCYP